MIKRSGSENLASSRLADATQLITEDPFFINAPPSAISLLQLVRWLEQADNSGAFLLLH